MFGGNSTNAFRKFTNWYYALSLLGVIYFAIAFYVMFKYHPVSRFLPFPSNSAESLLADLVFVMTPLVGAMVYYVVKLNNSQRKIRQEFLFEYQNKDLVYQRYNRNQIYLVLERNSSDRVTKMKVIWTPDGRCNDGTIYEEVEGENLKKFDPTRFEEG